MSSTGSSVSTRRAGAPRAFAAALVALLFGASAAHAQTALRTGLFVSDDADDTSVVKLSAGALFRYAGPASYRGLVVEQLRIRPVGDDRWDDQRVFYAFAGGEAWRWSGRVGTDGDTVIGGVNTVREGTVRQEYFIERDILETREGIRGRYHTFLGAAFDVPLGDRERQQATVLVGAQEFDGRNLRSHLRARYVAVLKPDWGLSAQLRTRAFHNSVPFESDYYSPRWFVEAMPTVQLRRFHRRWMVAGAIGWGQQRDSESAWRDARLVEASVTSPAAADRSFLRASASYSNTPTGAGASYGYRQLMVEWIKPF